MARKTVFIGTPPATRFDPFVGVPRPSWPDVDINRRQTDFSTLEQFKDARAIALSAETDWDMVRVYLKGRGNDPELLVPGRVLPLEPVQGGWTVERIEPVVQCPITRPYDGSLRNSNPDPNVAANWQLTFTGHFNNITSSDTLTVWKWTYAAGVGSWSSAGVATVPPGGDALDPADGTPVLLTAAGANHRAADFSPDGKWSFADYVDSGLIKRPDGTTAVGQAFVSTQTFDNRGNPGYVGAGVPLHINSFAPPSSLFYGRLALDVWDTPCVDFPPKLAPFRTLALPAVHLVGNGTGNVDTAVLTVPFLNVRTAALYIQNANVGANVHARLFFCTGAGALSAVGGNNLAPLTTADAAVANDACYFLSLDMDDSALPMSYGRNAPHPFLKILMGADVTVDLPAGSLQLTMARFVTG